MVFQKRHLFIYLFIFPGNFKSSGRKRRNAGMREKHFEKIKALQISFNLAEYLEEMKEWKGLTFS